MAAEKIYPATIQTRSTVSYQGGVKSSLDEKIVKEASVTLTVNGEEWFNFLCTPEYVDELSVGFLFNSQAIKTRKEIVSLKLCENGNIVDVWLTHQVEKPRLWQKNSGCSGGVSVPDLPLTPLTKSDRFSLTLAEINQILTRFYQEQKLYKISGGVHASALFSRTSYQFSAEDIGRHNTMDKLAGWLVLQERECTSPVIVTTGRVSLEMMQKSAMMRAAFVISRTSPTSASIELAQELGITLIGYAEYDRLKIYTFSENVSP